MADMSDYNLRDTRANQPAAGIPGREMFIEDERVRERDNGASWEGITDSPPYAKLQEQQTSGTNGGTFTASGSYSTRVLNTEVVDDGGIVSLVANQNQFILQAGTYRIAASAPAYHVGTHKAKLRNVPDGSDVIIGTSEFADTGSPGSQSRSLVCGQFTIAAEKIFEIQQECGTTQATNGLGVAVGYGDVEVYTIVELWKLS